MSSVKAYYESTASDYDALHDNEPDHTRAFELGWPLVQPAKSILDVGCGTGRGLSVVSGIDPSVELHGIEPSEQMLAVARKKVPRANLQAGTGEALPFRNATIDVVSAAGIMHHVDDPEVVISEMFRVAKKAVLISDHNNYAFGGSFAKKLRMGLKIAGMLGAFTYVKQGFKRQGYSEEDGWWYPYSLFENYKDIAAKADRLYIIPTRPATGQLGNIIFSQSHFCLIAIKRIEDTPR